MPDTKTKNVLKTLETQGKAYIRHEEAQKKRKKKSARANKAELLKMLIKGERYKMSRKQQKEQKELGKPKRKSLLVQYAERTGKPKTK